MPNRPNQAHTHTLVEAFVAWINRFDNQDFYSVQEAYRKWLRDEGFHVMGNDYTSAVTVMLVFLSRCVANPRDRRYLSNPPNEADEYTLLQVRAQEESDDETFWEFLAEESFRNQYSEWSTARYPQNS
jgi:hypothetical protein